MMVHTTRLNHTRRLVYTTGCSTTTRAEGMAGVLIAPEPAALMSRTTSTQAVMMDLSGAEGGHQLSFLILAG